MVDYIGEYCRLTKGDTRSLDYSSFGSRETAFRLGVLLDRHVFFAFANFLP